MRLNTFMVLLTSGTQFLIWIIDIITFTTTFTYSNTIRIKLRFITVILIIYGVTLHC